MDFFTVGIGKIRKEKNKKDKELIKFKDFLKSKFKKNQITIETMKSPEGFLSDICVHFNESDDYSVISASRICSYAENLFAKRNTK